METSKYKALIGWAAFFFILIHFSFIFLYASPPELVGNKTRPFASNYVSPIFDQKWAMFAPCPTINGHIQIKYVFDSDTTEWTNPVKQAAEVQAWFKMTHHAELLLAESNLLHWVKLDFDSMGLEPGDSLSSEQASKYYQGYSHNMVKNYVYGNGIYLFDKKVKSALVRCEMENVVTGEHGVTELPLFKW